MVVVPNESMVPRWMELQELLAPLDVIFFNRTKQRHMHEVRKGKPYFGLFGDRFSEREEKKAGGD